MKFVLLAIVSLFATLALAADAPTKPPGAEEREEHALPAESKGAIKMEKRPAVSPEELHKDDPKQEPKKKPAKKKHK